MNVLVFILGYIVVFIMLPVIGVWYNNKDSELIERVLMCIGVGILPVGFLIVLCIG